MATRRAWVWHNAHELKQSASWQEQPLQETSQVGWRRLWVRIGPRTIGVQDGRQGHGSPLALRTSGQRHFCNPAHCAAQLLFNIHDFLYESVGQPAPRLSNVARATFAREESKGNGPIPFPSTKNPA